MFIIAKRSDFSLGAVLLFLFLAVTSYIVIAVNESNSTGNASEQNLTSPEYLNLTLSNTTQNETIEKNTTGEINTTAIINETLPVNETDKIISLSLEYNPGTQWDKDDNGLEAVTGIIDFDVSDTEFNWEVDESKLCTKYEVYSLDTNNLTRVCYGSEKCCAMVDLQPTLNFWNDPFDIYVGRYGASLLNRISAMVVYADYNLSATEPFSEFYDSNTEELDANFTENMTIAAVPAVCTLPNVVFTPEDMDVESDNGVITARFEKDGVSAVLKNVDTSKIGKLEFKDGIFTADSVSIDSATIRVPHCSLNPVVIEPRLYIRDTGRDFIQAEPYCKNETTGDCFNIVKVTKDYYEYDVEHFTDYYVNSSGGGDYNNLKDCLDAINNTINSCIIIETGSYPIGGAYGYNITPYSYSGAIRADADSIAINCNNSMFVNGGTGNGIYTTKTNTTIKNCHFQNFGKGIYYENADLGLVEGSSGNNNGIGLMMWAGTNIKIKDSNFTNSGDFNIKLDGGTENISVINVDARYSGSVNLWAHTTAASNIIVINSKFGNSSSQTCVALVQSSAFINNTVENCLADDRAGLTIGTGSIIKDNLFYNNNVHIYLYSNPNTIVENNIFNKSNDADFLGFGIGFCLALLDNSVDVNVINNTFADCLDNGIIMAEVNEGGNLNSNNITGNVFTNATPSGTNKYLYISSIDVENTKVWLNNFTSSGVDDSGSNTVFCVNSQGNYYGEGISRPAGECQIDVFNLSRLYNTSAYNIFEFMIKDIDTLNNTVSWLFAPGNGESNITSGQNINLIPDEDVFVYVERNYTNTGSYEAVARANTSSASDEEKINVVVG